MSLQNFCKVPEENRRYETLLQLQERTTHGRYIQLVNGPESNLYSFRESNKKLNKAATSEANGISGHVSSFQYYSEYHPHLTGNISRLRYRAQPVNAVW
jgi:hypothetical protein